MKKHSPRYLAALLVLAILVSLFTLGCNGNWPEEVEIVSVSSGKYLRTTIEFPNGERRSRKGQWGSVGDRFMARRAIDNGWR